MPLSGPNDFSAHANSLRNWRAGRSCKSCLRFMPPKVCGAMNPGCERTFDGRDGRGKMPIETTKAQKKIFRRTFGGRADGRYWINSEIISAMLAGLYRYRASFRPFASCSM